MVICTQAQQKFNRKKAKSIVLFILARLYVFRGAGLAVAAKRQIVLVDIAKINKKPVGLAE